MDKQEFINNMKLIIDAESVNIYVEREGYEPICIYYCHVDEVKENTDVAISMCNAIDLFYRDREMLINTLGNVEGYFEFLDVV